MDVIICHGTMGSPKGNWFQWAKNRFEKLGHTVYVPTFPTPEEQTKDNWCEALRNQAPIFGQDTILIGHSISATFLLHILEVVKAPVHQSIFVSSVMDDIGNTDYDELNSSFVHHQFGWDTINKNKGIATIFHGDNDPYVPMSHAERLSENLKTPVSVIENGGHLNSESGYIEFPQLIDLFTA